MNLAFTLGQMLQPFLEGLHVKLFALKVGIAPFVNDQAYLIFLIIKNFLGGFWQLDPNAGSHIKMGGDHEED